MQVVRRALLAVAALGWCVTAVAQEDYVVLATRTTGTSIVKAPDGTLYGTGGSTGAFRITADGTYSEITPALPYGGSTLGSDGYFYLASGAQIVRFPLGGPIETLHRISNFPLEGTFPGKLVEGADGAFYGYNQSGGSTPSRIYRITSTGVLTTLYEFPADRANMSVNLTAGRDGNLYGTTSLGFDSIFRLTLTGSFTQLHVFTDASPRAALVETDDGFYGAAASNTCGRLFRLRPDGGVDTVYQFTVPESCGSITPLIEGRDGRLYGTTDNGIFTITREGGGFRLLHSSGGVPGWAGSDRYGWGFSALVQGNDGNFYGTGKYGGRPGNNGVVFRLNAVRSACVNDYELIWSGDATGGNLYSLGAIKSEMPAFLATFFVSRFGVTPVFVGPIPSITPALAYEQAVTLPSPIGSVGLLSILITSDLQVCSAWQTVDTGGGGSPNPNP